MIIRRESGIPYFGSTCFTKYQSDVDFDKNATSKLQTL